MARTIIIFFQIQNQLARALVISTLENHALLFP